MATLRRSIARLIRRLAHLAISPAQHFDLRTRRKPRPAPAMPADQRSLELPDPRSCGSANLRQIDPRMLPARVALHAQERESAIDRGAQRRRGLHRPAEQAHATIPRLAAKLIGALLRLLCFIVLVTPRDAASAPGRLMTHAAISRATSRTGKPLGIEGASASGARHVALRRFLLREPG